MHGFSQLVVLWFVTTHVRSYKIVLFSHTFTSHIRQIHMVGEELSERGHDVYSVLQRGFMAEDTLGIRTIKPLYYDVPDNVATGAQLDKMLVDSVFHKRDPSIQFNRVTTTSLATCNQILHNANFMDLLKHHQFDLALVDHFKLGPCLFLVPHVLGVGYVGMGAANAINAGATPTLPSFSPLLSLPHNEVMNFKERLVNTLTFVFTNSDFFPPHSDKALLREFAPEFANWMQVVDKCVLHCIYRDHILDWPVPMMPNVIHTPAPSVKPSKPLTSEYKQFLDASTRSVIIMSFGSSIPDFPVSIAKKFVEAFSMMNYTVFWRYNGSKNDLSAPNNVKFVTWLPQNDLLGHASTRLFISHCGANGLYEAIYHGVPVLGFPLFAEQPANCLRVETRKLGKCKDIFDVSPADLVNDMEEMIADGSDYQINMKKRSAILKDTDPHPIETMIRWIEHVMNHGGDHLQSHAVDMTWYQYWMIDILILIGVCIHVITICSYLIIRACCCKSIKYKQS